jgi:tRNA(Ile)-lysidine synthase
MKEKLVGIVKNFLQRLEATDQPLLIGYSGGPDSTALLHLFLECQRFYPVQIQLVHVDHGWRKESGEQAALLKAQAASLGLPFHLYRLEGVDSEEGARQARLAIFQKLSEHIGAQAMVFAHHQDDQAETVLKRIFEGAGFYALGGMSEVSQYEGMNLWRPLLSVAKQELLDYLQKKGISYFDDETNRDPQYLRARLRTQLFPEVETIFGKEIGGNLSRLGQTVQELSHYLDRRIGPLWKSVRMEEGVITCDLTPFFPLEKVELRLFLTRLAKREGIFLSFFQLETLVQLVLDRSSAKEILTKTHRFSLEKGILFLIPSRIKQLV